MKKILGLSAIAMAMCGLVIGCASTSTTKTASAGSSVPHPRTYIIDVADATGGNVTTFEKATDGGAYYKGSDMQYTDYVLNDPPRKGDTLEIHFKGTSNIDLSGFELCITDDSPAANYWTNLINQDKCDLAFATDIKAGVPFEGVLNYELDVGMKAKGRLKFYFFYDNSLMSKKGFAKVGQEATITWEKTGVETTDTSLDAPSDAPVVVHPAGAVNFDLNLVDCAKMIQLPVNASDGTIWNYQAIFGIDDLFPTYLPKAGDTITLTWKGTSDITIEKPVMMTLVENTPAVGWWQDKVADDESKFHVFAEGVEANKEFTGTATFTLCRDCVEGISVQMYYEPYEGATGATWIFTRE